MASVKKMMKDAGKNVSEAAVKASHPKVVNKQGLTAEKIRKFLPKGSSPKITDELVEMLNNAERDSGVCQELFEEQFLSYLGLMEGGAGIEKLANAIKFCNLRLLPNMTNEKAYRIVFPKKADELEAAGKDMSSFASMYNGTKLVREISKLLLVPVYISHAPVHIAMHKKLFDLTNGIGANPGEYVSPTVQMNSAVALMEATKMPEDNSIELKIGMSDEAKSAQQSLADQIRVMTELQLAQLKSGKSVDDVQKVGINIVDADVEE